MLGADPVFETVHLVINLYVLSLAASRYMYMYESLAGCESQQPLRVIEASPEAIQSILVSQSPIGSRCSKLTCFLPNVSTLLDSSHRLRVYGSPLHRIAAVLESRVEGKMQ